MDQQSKVLSALLERARAAAGALVVFDLDDTLLATGRRHLRILREYAARRREAAALAALTPAQLRYAIVDTAKAAGLGDPALLEELRGFWFERFFKNEYLLEDEPNAGAAQYCADVLESGAQVVYLTGRDEAMRAGTLAALEAHGFPPPAGSRVSLMLKPRFETPDAEFKDEAIQRLKGMGAVVGSFENEPSHVNLFHASFPGATHVFVDTKHSGKPVAPHPSVPWIKDFRRF